MRIDKWLWAARFFKTRTLAAQAVATGRVDVNGERAKPAKAVRTGDRLEIRRPPFAHDVEVLGVAERRGPAAEAQALYRETVESVARRAALAAELRAAPPRPFRGRPTKKERRDFERLQRDWSED